jgi:hypothetical protein
MAEFLKKYPCPNDDEDDGVLEVWQEQALLSCSTCEIWY